MFFFFFQAEDGIRDLVRSRGLGDVYKRQLFYSEGGLQEFVLWIDEAKQRLIEVPIYIHTNEAVSYTHLTLPTSDLV